MTRASDLAKLLGAGATILDGTTISTADNTTQLTLTSTDEDASKGPILDLTRNSASPANNDVMGRIRFKGENSADEEVSYAFFEAEVKDVTDGAEDGKLIAKVLINGTHREVLSLTRDSIVINQDSQDLDFRVESNGNANMLFVDAGNDAVGIGNNNPADYGSTAIDLVIGTTSGENGMTIVSGTGNGGRIQFADNTASPFRGAFEYDHGSDGMIIYAAGSERMRLHSDGNISIGKSAANNTTAGTTFFGTDGMSVVRSGATVQVINRLADDGVLVSFRQAGGDEGNISVSGSTISYNAFSGSHWSRLTDNSKPTLLKGTIIETIDEMCDWYQAKFTIPATTKKDEEGKDVENTPEVTEKISIALPNGKSVGDTISYTHEGVTYDDAVIIKEDDNKHTKCKISDIADSKRVYGVYADWDNDDDTVNDMYVTAVGTHVVRINKDITVSAGDLLSSNGDGTAKVQDDDIIRSKTIGKVLTNIKQETYSDGSYTVPCALYCG